MGVGWGKALLSPETYTYTAKRYTFPYTRMRMEQDHEKLEVSRVALDFAAWVYTVYRTLIERGNLVREQGIVYVYVYVYVYE